MGSGVMTISMDWAGVVGCCRVDPGVRSVRECVGRGFLPLATLVGKPGGFIAERRLASRMGYEVDTYGKTDLKPLENAAGKTEWCVSPSNTTISISNPA